MEKVWYQSRTLWVNLIGIAAMLIQRKVGWVLDAENEVIILGVINLILRLVTKKPVVFS